MFLIYQGASWSTHRFRLSCKHQRVEVGSLFTPVMQTTKPKRVRISHWDTISAVVNKMGSDLLLDLWECAVTLSVAPVLRWSSRTCWCAWSASTLSTTWWSVSASDCSGAQNDTHSEISGAENTASRPLCLFRVHEINSLLAPFDYTTQPSWQNPKYLGEWRVPAACSHLHQCTDGGLWLSSVCVISTEVTYVLGGLVFAWIVEEWVWDYAITVTLLHVAMTVAGKT